MSCLSSPKDRNRTPEEFFVGVDVGGSSIKIGVVTSAGRPLSFLELPTEGEKGPEHGLATIQQGIVDAVEQSPIRMRNLTAIGVAVPGTLDIPNGMWLEPANLPTWRNIPIRQLVSDHFSLPTVLHNDANAAAYGEFWAGAGRGAHSLAMWTLGTGIGCGLIVNEQLVTGAHSHGGECGFLYIQMEGGRPSATGMTGTLEGYVGSSGLMIRCQEALDRGDSAPLLRERLDGGEPLSPRLIAEVAEHGDALAVQLIEDSARFMAYGTANLMHTIDPDVVLFGGNMTFGRNETALGRRFVEIVREEVRRLSFPVPSSKIRIDYAELGGQAGFIGAAGCACAEFGTEALAARRNFAC
ncbi:ROK family protein [bacterium]|nr:ROK family protein [bacterium]